MEKTITVRRTTITFSIWDLGGQREFVNMLPLVCNDAVAILFMFDLSRKSTLNSVKEWYRQARGFNKVGQSARCPISSLARRRMLLRHGGCRQDYYGLSYGRSRAYETHIILSQTAIPFLIGTKFDTFATFPRDEQEEITKQVCRLVNSSDLSTDKFAGEAICASNACIPHLLLNIRIDQCSKDFQDSPCEGIRLEMRDPRDRRCWRTGAYLCGRVTLWIECSFKRREVGGVLVEPAMGSLPR